MKRIFGGLSMKWPQVIAFAALTGLYTGLIMLVPTLRDTSFQDIGISYEWWVIFAVIVVVNCKSGLEAMLKCFVFFLISQPLVYITEGVCGYLPLSQGLGYYYLRIWLPATFLTLPGGLIAYYCKKQSLIGSIILGLGHTILAVCGLSYLITAVAEFPHHLLSVLVCFGSIVILGLSIQKQKRYRFLSWIIPGALLLVLILLVKVTGRYIVSGVF